MGLLGRLVVLFLDLERDYNNIQCTSACSAFPLSFMPFSVYLL